MIKAKFTRDNGSTVIILGLSDGNLEQLKAGKPICFNGDHFGMPNEVFIIYGKTEMEICREYGIPVPQ